MEKVDGRFEKWATVGLGKISGHMCGLIGDTPPIFGIV